MITAAQLLLLIVAAPATLACGYLLILTLLSGRLPQPRPSSRRLRFDVIVPAHNEALSIERTVASLSQIDWPADRFRVLVVADNCSDATAELARSAGAEVLERRDHNQRGKGYALRYAFERSAAASWADAVVVVDADGVVSPNLLEACAARIEAGAQAVQVHYGTLNPFASWRTRLVTIAKAAFHIVRSRARERLGLSCGIRGNGWCVTHALLRELPYRAFSLTEDVEYGLQLGLASHRVYYADEAHADAEMAASEQSARSQRQRWEGGRHDLMRRMTWPLLRAAAAHRSRVCLDLALDLIVLPLSYVVVNVAVFVVLATGLAMFLPSLQAWLWLAAGCAAALVTYVLRGWQLSGTGLQGLLDLARAPLYLVWKIVLMLRRGAGREWVRTEREGS